MNKTTKRILCGALSVMMVSTLAVEGALRLNADENYTANTTIANATFKNVTGQYDTSALMQQNFNDSVLSVENTAPKYETRSVMITLDSAPIIKRANGEAVAEYLDSWVGSRAAAEIKAEQTEFLKALSKTGISFKHTKSYDTVLNGVAIEVNTKHVSAIKKMAGVKSVVITTKYEEPQLAEVAETSGVVTNETEVYATGIYDSSKYAAEYGEGTVVAILDTGLDYTHPAFQRFESDDVDVAWSYDYVKSMVANKDLVAETRSGSLSVNDVYVNEKVPFAYDYADDDPDVYPSYSNHGTHVAGIIGGYDTNGYTDKDGNPIDETFKGVVPDAQLVICKVFTDDLDDPDLGGAIPEDICAALEDCVKLGVDVINMSLGTSAGFTTTDDGDDEGEMLNSVYESIQDAGISLVCAASNDYSSGYGGVYGTNLASNPDSGTVGSPSTFASALSVASINGQKASYAIANKGTKNESFVFYEESRDIDGNPYEFAKTLNETYPSNNGEFDYVIVSGVGHAADYSTKVKRLLKEDGVQIAVIKRGDTTFEEKVRVAKSMGAEGVIIYNNVSGVIRMNLGELEDPIPAVSVNMNAGTALVKGAGSSSKGTLTVDELYTAGPFMSEFSSWGPTHDLKLKPEITAHGGEITSTVPGGYGEQSGTSMASPNMAGFMALVRSYVKNTLGVTDAKEINRLAMQLTMSTAGTVYDQDGLPYSPRKQGAGVARLQNVIGGTQAYLWTDNAENDYRPKLELGDDEDKTGVYEMRFKVTNFGADALSFTTAHEAMTETLSGDKLTVAEQAHLLNGDMVWKVNGNVISAIEVQAGETVDVEVTFTLSEEDRDYLDAADKSGKIYFENGMYVEGFLKLVSASGEQCDLSIPFLGFYGDWESSPMLDYTAYEVAADAQNAAVKEEDKIQASVWATLPYSMYYNEKYILPMGGYVYLLPDDAEEMYVSEAHAAISRYNDYYGEGNVENYLTSTGIKAVYAGLLKNARLVKYRMYNEATGELILEDELNRIGKAYSGGGQGVPANVELEIRSEEAGLVANGKYRMEFEFFQDMPTADEVAPEENTYEFSFTVDYEAPVLQDVRVRYYNYEENNKPKQTIYLDVDVYDNHYAQAMMLCYPKTNAEGEVVLQLATEYPTPIRNAKENGMTTVSIDITDIYEKYGNQLYVQVDDYAVNSCLYQVDINEANKNMLPGEFELGAGEENVTLDIYDTHKVALSYNSAAGDPSNFIWTSLNPSIAEVKNGEIVGLKAGTTKVTVNNRHGVTRTINVKVTDTVKESVIKTAPAISFDVIKTDYEALEKAEGAVSVSAGMEFTLEVLTDPWYHPMTDLRLVWNATNPAVASVDDNGTVKTFKKGTSAITARIERWNASANRWDSTLYTASVTLVVQNEFTVSNYTLTKYNGVGGEVTIPSDMNIWYIGEEAFKDNANVTKIVIPSTVIDIRERAFMNCTALEEVYFVSTEHREDGNGNILNPDIDWADVSMIYEQAFYNCPKLRKVDFSNAKTLTVAADCFAECVSLEEVVDMPSIGTMHHRAFMNCKDLKNADLSGLHMSGNNVFQGCTSLAAIKTGKFTAIGNYMFQGCTGLRNTVKLYSSKVGTGAFMGCTNLSGVQLLAPEGETDWAVDIGARAFENCGKNLKGNFKVEFSQVKLRTIGDRAFANSKLAEMDFTAIKGLENIGGNVFAGTNIVEITIGDNVDLEGLQVSGAPFAGKIVKVAAGSTKYTEENGVIYSADKSKLLFVNESVTGEFTLPATVKAIASYAFAGSNVTKVILSSALTEMGAYAFANAKLTEIDMGGASLTQIPQGAFSGSSLKAIALPDSVSYVADSAFANSSISEFTANGLTKLGNRVFENCVALGSKGALVLDADIKTMGSNVFAGCTALTEVTMPAVESLGRTTFMGARNLQKVTFAEGATTVGTYTFTGTGIREVVFLGTSMERIDDGAFYNCRNLQSITLPNGLKTVGVGAFSGCSSLTSVNGIENVETFEVNAFYNTKLSKLTLTNAKVIGDMAFGTQANNGNDVDGAYDEISMPNVEVIGNYAFLNGAETSVELPASLVKLGEGVFGSSKYLTEIKVADGNGVFFVENGAVYRYVDKENGEFELVAYPSALQAADGEYSVKEGTVRVAAYAFYHINGGTIDKITLPYSLNAIGDSAFYKSGIDEYSFESIKAPTLETIHREEISQMIEQASSIAYYKGYYYCNFETYLYNFTRYVGDTSTLIMNYPSNGTGYTNHIYTLYFGTRNASANALIEDETRACVTRIEELPTAEEVEAWLAWENTEENVAKIVAFSDALKVTRVYYNNAMQKAEQSVFLSEEHTEKLLAVESALRQVKAQFNIKVSISQLKVDETSTHKTQYNVGETFDMAGLVIVIVYDDYSNELASPEEITLLTTEELGIYDKYVEVEVRGKTTRVQVNVKDPNAVKPQPPVKPDDNSASDSTPAKPADNSIWIYIELGAAALVLIVGVIILISLKKKNAETPEQPTPTQPTEQPTAEQPAEEAPVEEAVEEQPAEETPAEEVVEEQPAEEAPIEEAPAEEVVEEQPIEEAPAEEAVEEQPAEEAPVEEAVEEQPVEETPAAEKPKARKGNMEISAMHVADGTDGAAYEAMIFAAVEAAFKGKKN